MGNHDADPGTMRKAKLAMKGESTRKDTCIMGLVTGERQNNAKLSEKYHSISAVVPIGLEVKHCNMLIWKWDLRRGKTLKEEKVQQYCFQCK